MARLRKRHRPLEIAEKLRVADKMLQEQKTASEIAHALGVSKMTYYRWRASETSRPVRRFDRAGAATQLVGLSNLPPHLPDARLRQLETENDLLRRALGDLLVEKVMLEERLRKAS